ncbi:glycine--tRNA ligase subunit beta [Luminiphilus sp.]|jgi:glycyl-tRNA synthetase beta chain|nr:glycine--tRNA ligase subunit beta [Luminiphilus sp.]MDA8679771.1 glycine--tRNA ligase subunit beta [Luminiphilus sp.]MDC0410972.1 glycine--tRNA ligase subunit beta [Luminiphilus sp.]
MSTADLLFELGTEELPAGEIERLVAALSAGVTSGLTEQGLPFSHARCFSTPRRLAVLISDVTLKGPDIERTVVGPPVSAARNETGGWTKAAEGFARKQGITLDDLIIREEQGVERIVANIAQVGVEAASVIPEIVSAAVNALPVSKRMRWGRTRYDFLRPVQWLVLLLGEAILPLELFGRHSGRESRGHRFHANHGVSITTPSEYTAALHQAKVMADVDERRARVAEQVSQLQDKGEQVALSDELLNEVTGLVEWPVALRGSFDKSFLDVPAQALISAMKTHQKYFHITDQETGALLPVFITVANIESQQPSEVIAGNQRVIRPRLSDAAFFFANDKQSTLVSRRDRLSSVVFQRQLGSLLDKSQRMETLAATLADATNADHDITARAAALAKCDLVSEMVLEFPELQGIAGAHYARHDGEPDGVANAIEAHYYPRFAGDALPSTPEATAVALADRLDTLVGIFGIGQPPTGSKDPFGLRRAALAIIRMLIACDHPLSLDSLLESACAQHSATLAPDTADQVLQYLLERLDNWYESQSIHVEVVRAVLAVETRQLHDIDLRIKALAAFAETDTAQQLAAANKRVANILAKASEQDATPPDPSLFQEPAEQALHNAVIRAGQALTPLIAARDYQAALAQLATLRAPVDDFFESVMVNAENPAERVNRLRLLGTLRALFTQLADLALLSSGSE